MHLLNLEQKEVLTQSRHQTYICREGEPDVALPGGGVESLYPATGLWAVSTQAHRS